ncbi:MAG: VWA domain-containing protein, partial [Pseudomonadales bacterium]
MNQLNSTLLSLANFDATLFHFMRPEMLWALPALLVFWLLLRRTAGSHRWEQYIPKELVAALQTDTSERTSLWRILILVIWALLVVAAAGPSWQKQTAPVVENQRAVIIVLDLSPSMMAQDLKPDRLTRAKYKLIDVLRGIADGHIGLVAYAGDAHTVSPLSDDPKTLEALLPALYPSIMPSTGSNVEAGVTLAIQLLKDAGVPSGEIILITDGVTETALDSVRDIVSGQIKRLSILGVGTATAAPIPQSRGGFLRDSQGEIILSRINSAELSGLAASLGGTFVQVSADGSDVSELIA